MEQQNIASAGAEEIVFVRIFPLTKNGSRYEHCSKFEPSNCTCAYVVGVSGTKAMVYKVKTLSGTHLNMNACFLRRAHLGLKGKLTTSKKARHTN